MYAFLETLAPISHQAFVRQYPNTSFPATIPEHILLDYGLAKIEQDPRPENASGLGALRREGDRIFQAWEVGSVELPDLETIFSNQMQKLNDEYTAVFSELRSNYPACETETWPTQASEARLFSAWQQAGQQGPAPITPFLTALHNSRTEEGIDETFAELAGRVLANDAVYTPAVAKITAVRHAAERRLEAALAAKDTVAMSAVTWSFVLVSDK